MTVHVTPNTAFQIDKNERILDIFSRITKRTRVVYRFELFVYNEAKLDEMPLNSKGGLEISAINCAYNNNTKLTQSSLFIIKITSRFFISSFQEFINNINLDEYDGLNQNFNNRCKIVGTHINNFKIMFDKNLFVKNGIYNYNIEDVYDYRLLYLKNNYLYDFVIEKTQGGGLYEFYTTL